MKSTDKQNNYFLNIFSKETNLLNLGSSYFKNIKVMLSFSELCLSMTL